MKRILPHPPRPERPNIWRSLSELENAPDFQEALQREFPRGADVYDESGLSKRDFLKLMGASMALAGVGMTGCRRPPSYIVPLRDGVEWTIPGKYLYYATAMPTRLGAIPLVASTVDGRPTKLEGNPVHPYSNGGTDTFAQASILDLYDPQRIKTIRQSGLETDEEALDKFIGQVRSAGGAGFAVLANVVEGPTRDRLRDELKRQFPEMIWAEYDPLLAAAGDQAVRDSFGEGLRLVPNFEAADVILALDCDFLCAADVGPQYAAGFYRRRDPDGQMNRLYAVENHYTHTGGLADHRLRLKASEIGPFTVALAAAIGGKTGNSALSQAAAQYKGEALKVDPKWLEGVADDLLAHRGKSLVLVGDQQPAAVQSLGFAINQALGNVGQTLKATRKPASDVATIADLCKAIERGAVQTLFILGGNPLYDAPADLGFAQLLTEVPMSLHLTPFEVETSAYCKWVVPATHYLEEWNDTRTFDGTYTAVQPMILPLWNGISQLQLLAKLAGLPTPEGPELIKETFTKIAGSSGQQLDLDWNQFLQDGFRKDTAFEEGPLSFNAGSLGQGLDGLATPDGSGEIVFLRSSTIDDGRYAHNAWLQETPDFETKLTWDNAFLVSPATARELEIRDGDMLELKVDNQTLRAAALIAPGNADKSFSIALGYGRHGVSPLMQEVGFNAYPLRTTKAMRFRTGATVERLGGAKYPLARPQETRVMEGRDLVREGTLEHFREDPTFAASIGMDSHIPPNNSIYKNPYFDGEGTPLVPEQWAMTVDLNVCDGCNACVVACQAENNVPVVGKDQVIRGRDMAWIRIDRYFANPNDLQDKEGELAGDPEMLAQAILCQQCENAPCETVCPVNATVHSEDGLNLMAYNRCIGTRYCANNCPWKVRRFNYFDYNERPLDKLYYGPLAEKGMAESVKMVKNPNVTVRMRGVMEKCTFCIQRIEEAKIARIVKAGPTNKYETSIAPFKTACQQACPSGAIVFGNMNDPKQLIAKTRENPRGFTMLKYLNARPRITYLARIKNPNMAMPGAEGVGNINTPSHHGHGAGHGGDSHGGHGDTHGHETGHGAPTEHLETGAIHGADDPPAAGHQTAPAASGAHQADPHHPATGSH